ncbi:hypothetical protein G6F46_004778 [Rhizopus delemar]|uniref:Glycosyltransferase 2-like domain-containing protein n=3 Tax=Rhizopus TaxID=4842 RepID=I1C9Y6_RHIO9|nr:hypothetical protein RO3G_09976 [Rhizopus delemar RA 99-880]KAG1462809.1 hypothetical protein G6F55_002753 [Rhizopus delemar]KAG1546567.1 hypothetical protein G6F51_004797 [Rhizopus arrhizus]KAG1500229.1 hypothetical protein G6F54_003854 [Rhizopus delemar]KAG1513755.1 hypothetical protein G6F53_004189 [Rhizopus delemar]|eukprot:EIE85266.1 hypothetical protein RO3G_09976 [Rhizopus delemar RA 99-880]
MTDKNSVVMMESDDQQDIIQTTKYVANTGTRMNLTRQEWENCLHEGQAAEFYLSIVLVTRMDDYAGNQHHRFQNFIDSAYLLAEHSKQKIELLIIEWNPPVGKRRVLDAFRFRRSDYLSYRIITVSSKIHSILPNLGNAPLHEFEGKNVGIRFARGEFIVCTNQDDIWSHNFINAIQSRVFERDTIYVQYQSRHDIHENLPPSIVNLKAFPDDDTLWNACKLKEQDWGNYRLPGPSVITPDTYWYYGDQAGDFTLAHRDTWKHCRGYRETGGVAWVDIEFILTAVGHFNKTLVYSGDSFACHQEHPNEWEKTPERHTDKQAISVADILNNKTVYVNEEGKWALYHVDIWQEGLECFEFSGGLGW